MEVAARSLQRFLDCEVVEVLSFLVTRFELQPPGLFGKGIDIEVKLNVSFGIEDIDSL